jgi:hypothetical protein
MFFLFAGFLPEDLLIITLGSFFGIEFLMFIVLPLWGDLWEGS